MYLDESSAGMDVDLLTYAEFGQGGVLHDEIERHPAVRIPVLTCNLSKQRHQALTQNESRAKHSEKQQKVYAVIAAAKRMSLWGSMKSEK